MSACLCISVHIMANEMFNYVIMFIMCLYLSLCCFKNVCVCGGEVFGVLPVWINFDLIVVLRLLTRHLHKPSRSFARTMCKGVNI